MAFRVPSRARPRRVATPVEEVPRPSRPRQLDSDSSPWTSPTVVTSGGRRKEEKTFASSSEDDDGESTASTTSSRRERAVAADRRALQSLLVEDAEAEERKRAHTLARLEAMSQSLGGSMDSTVVLDPRSRRRKDDLGLAFRPEEIEAITRSQTALPPGAAQPDQSWSSPVRPASVFSNPSSGICSETSTSSSRKPPRGESPPFSPTTPAPPDPPSGVSTMPAILRPDAPSLRRQDSSIASALPTRLGRSISSPAPNPPPISVPPTLRRPAHPKDLESMERAEWAKKTGRSDVLGYRTGEKGLVVGEGARDRWGNRWGHESHVLSPVISERTERSESGVSTQTSVTSKSRLSMHSNNSLLRRLQQSSVPRKPRLSPRPVREVQLATESLAVATVEAEARKEEKRKRREEREKRRIEAQTRDETFQSKQRAKRSEQDKREKMLVGRDGILQQLAERPGDAKLIRDLGKLYLLNGSNEATLKLAVRYLEQSIQLDNTDANAWLFLARAWSLLSSNHPTPSPSEREQRTSNAAIGFRKAIVLASQAKPGDGNQYRLAYAEHLEEQGRFKEAAGVLQTAIDADGTDSESWWELAKVMEAWADRGDLPERISRLRSSFQAYDAAAKLEPHDQEIQEGLVKIRQRLDQLDPAPTTAGTKPGSVSPSVTAATTKDTQHVSPMQAPAGSVRSRASKPPSPSQLSPPVHRSHTPSSGGWRAPSPSSLPPPIGTPRILSPPAIPPRPRSRPPQPRSVAPQDDEYHFSLLTSQLQSLVDIDNERRAEIAALRQQFDHGDKEADRRRAEVFDHIRRLCSSPAIPRPPSVRPPSVSPSPARPPSVRPPSVRPQTARPQTVRPPTVAPQDPRQSRDWPEDSLLAARPFSAVPAPMLGQDQAGFALNGIASILQLLSTSTPSPSPHAPARS